MSHAMTIEGLHWADYLIFCSFLLISLAIGVYHALSGGRQRTTAEFILNNRQLKVLPTMMSFVMSFVSALMVLGVVAEMYTHGMALLVWDIVAFIFSMLLTAQMVIPWLFPLKLTSAFEYLERRYKSRAARATGCFLGIMKEVIYMGFALFAPSLAMQAVTGVSLFVSIPVMAILATTYTSLGGIRAVVWTDVFQGLIMLLGVLAICIRSYWLVGFTNSYKITLEAGRLQWFDWSFDPTVRHTVWSLTIGFTVSWITLFGFSQSAVQRYSAMQSVTQSKLMMLCGIPVVCILCLVLGVTGLNIFSYFTLLRCDPLDAGLIRNSNQLQPYFVKVAFSSFQGFTGLLLSMLYSGALSSVSSSLSGCSTNIWEDALKPTLSSKVTEWGATFINKALVVVLGLVSMGLGLLCSILPGTLIQVTTSLMGACGGPLMGMFLLGGIFRSANWIGAVAGGWISFAFVLHLNIIAKLRGLVPATLPPAPIDGCPGNITTRDAMVNENVTLYSSLNTTSHASDGALDLYTISYLWYTPLGVLVTVVVGLITSYCARAVSRGVREAEVEEECLISWRTLITWKEPPTQNKFKKSCGETTDGSELEAFKNGESPLGDGLIDMEEEKLA